MLYRVSDGNPELAKYCDEKMPIEQLYLQLAIKGHLVEKEIEAYKKLKR